MPKDRIAIVGTSVRLPGGCHSAADFWNILLEGRDLITEVSDERWNTDAYHYPEKDIPGKAYTKSAGQIDNIWDFDAGFFNISPREAAQMDPQQRLLLELSWEAFEDAGIKPSSIRGSNTSVYVGISSTEFGSSKFGDTATGNSFFMLGTTMSIASNRLSYFYDIHGSSMSVDTACSSSLYALDLACQKIRSGQSDMAICGGVSILLTPQPFVGFSQANMLSPDGRCMAFDSRGNGYVRSEGGGILILKRLDKALEDGDTIMAVVAGAGTNSDGRTNGISLPSSEHQEQLLRSVYKSAHVEPGEVDYIEAHGTGTVVGDAAEVGAIGRFFGEQANPEKPLLIGSAKTNAGHLEAGSGMIGLIKAALVVKNRMVPPTLHVKEPRSDIPFAEYGLKIATEGATIGQNGSPVTVGVNSFGFGGANGHAILQTADTGTAATKPAPVTGQDVSGHLPPLLLSARSDFSLKASALEYAEQLAAANMDTAAYLELASSALHYREQFEERIGVLGQDVQEIHDALVNYADEDSPYETAISGQTHELNKPIAYIFSGNGTQFVGMARELLTAAPVFAEVIGRIDALVQQKSGWSVIDKIQNATEDEIADTMIAQPLIMTVQIAIVEYLASMGIKPDAVFGHSVGEIAAAYASGALTLEQAVDVILARSAAQAKTRGKGGMAALEMDQESAEALIQELNLDVVIAGINGPTSMTLSGDDEDLISLKSYCKQRSILYKKLDLEYPFHSPHMDPIEAEIRQSLSGLTPAEAKIPFLSTVSGEETDGQTLDAEYWWHNIRQPVKFRHAIEAAWEKGCRLFIEIGPKSILTGYVRNTLKQEAGQFSVLGSLTGKDDARRVAELPTHVYVNGGKMDFTALLPKGAKPDTLPRYVWDKQTYFLEPTSEANFTLKGSWGGPLLGERSISGAPEWKRDLGARQPGYLIDHQVTNTIVFPAAGFLEIALSASRGLHGGDAQVVENLEIHVPLVLEEKTLRSVRTRVSGEDGRFDITTRPYLSDSQGMTNVTGNLGGAPLVEATPKAWGQTTAGEAKTSFSASELYAFVRGLGLDYGPAFQGIRDISCDGETVVSHIVIPEFVEFGPDDYLLHPTLTDSCLQSLFVLLQDHSDIPQDVVFLPSVFGKVAVYQGGVREITCHARISRISARSIIADFQLTGPDGSIVAMLEDCRFRRFDSASRAKTPTFYQQALVPADPFGDTVALPPADEVAARVHAANEGLADDKALFKEEVVPIVDALVTAFTSEALVTLGANMEAGFSVEGLVASGAVSEDQTRFLTYLLGLMEEDGLLVQADGLWKQAEDAAFYEPAQIWRLLTADHSELLPELVLAGRTGDALADILSGRKDSASLPYLSGTAIPKYTVEGSVLTQEMDETVNAAVLDLVQRHEGSGRLRILELDGPNVLATHALVNALPEDRFTYTYTASDADILQRANTDLAPVHGVDCVRITDTVIEEIEALATANGCFDILVCRSTPWSPPAFEILTALSKRILRKGGMLVLAQNSRGRIANLIAGGNPAWWDRSPSDDKPSPLPLSEKAWAGNLEQQGHLVPHFLLSEQESRLENGLVLLGTKTSLPALLDTDPEQTEASPDAPSNECLLILQDDQDTDLAIAEAVQRHFNAPQVIFVQTGPEQASAEGNHHVVDIATPAGFAALGKTLLEKGLKVTHMVHLAGLAATSEAAALEAQDDRCTALVSLLRGFEQTILPQKPRLTIVTAGSQPSPDLQAPVTPAQAPLWGLGRVVANEYPDLQTRLVDLPALEGPADTDGLGSLIAREMTETGTDKEVVYRNGVRLSTRIRPLDLTTGETEGHDNVGLSFKAPGALENLGWFKRPRPTPKADEICIDMQATGLNFRDVMWAMGILKDEAVENGYAGPTLGMEGAGVITSVGQDVTDFQPGDRVMCFASDCFSDTIVTKTTAVAKIPDEISFEEAATIPSVFFTIYYALDYLARLQPGERVLIHGAAGGVGLAALQYCQHIGAEIYVTAGSDEKRNFLKLLGCENILDSRSLEYADRVMELTNGEGVDVVLNSLSGQAITKNLAILRPFGRFLELGKRDFYADSKIGLRPFRNNITYYGIDADQLLIEKPALSARLFKDMMVLFEQGVFKPLVHYVFRPSQIEEAFRTMQQSRHIGKIVVSMADKANRRITAAPKPQEQPRLSDGCCVVTGGLGGFGLASADWLSRDRFSHFALMGRSGVKTEQDQAVIDGMIARGVRVEIIKADVTDRAALQAALDALRADGTRITGVLHCAMVLDDGLIMNVEADRLQNVLSPKITGAWNLHELTANDPLEMFALYSSATTYIGNPGQASYVAGNSYLEALAAYRQRLGLPATALAWGAINDVGVLAANEDVKDILVKRTGLKAMNADTALSGLGLALDNAQTNAAVLQLNWGSITNGFPSGQSARYDDIRHLSSEDAGGGDADDLLAELMSLPADEARAMIQSVIVNQISAITGTAAEKIAPQQSLFDLGIDSLMTLELTMELERKLGVELSSMSVLGGGNITDLSENIAKLILGEEEEAALTSDHNLESVMAQHGLSGEADVLKDVMEEVSGVGRSDTQPSS
ncbi:type I polyketide synthase [Sneathiella chinensis]|uniref:type I polyketide synthase n=1 Tax=Sneathiella chinensis TaxID=349750 RepID=UPI00146AB9B1|nr:type I polyketide synthase [Sneathiella chinensis]